MLANILTGFQTLAMLTPPSAAEYLALIPGSIVAIVAMIVILVDTFHRPGTRRDYLAYISAIGLGLAGLSAYLLWDNTVDGTTFHGMLYLDRFALFFVFIACLSGGLAMLQTPPFMKFSRMDRGEFYMLVLFSVSGAIFMANAADLLTIFIALEIMSIPVYCLAGYMRRDPRGAESSMKYFILGAFSAGLMLYGMSMIYGITGTTNLEHIGTGLNRIVTPIMQNGVMSVPEAAQDAGLLLTVAILLILSGFAFKIAAVPFHIWTPDVYTGSPSPAVGFMATTVKAGAFAAMIRVFMIAFESSQLKGGFFGIGWIDVFFFLAAASMVLGNVVAIMQTNVKRMLAYSSIAHAGYLLLGFVAAGSDVKFFLHNDTVLFYLLTYTTGTVGAFGVLSILGRKGRTVETYEDLTGLGLKYPFAGLMMGIFMFSSAGVPPTAGFVGKFYIFSSAVQVGNATGEFSFIGLAILAVLTSVAGAYYYLKVLVCMYMREESEPGKFEMAQDSGAKFALVVAAVLTLWLGVAPGAAIQTAREAVVDFGGASPALQQTLDDGAKQLEQMEQRSKAAEQTPPPSDEPLG